MVLFWPEEMGKMIKENMMVQDAKGKPKTSSDDGKFLRQMIRLLLMETGLQGRDSLICQLIP